jgi:hypothetical protein
MAKNLVFIGFSQGTSSQNGGHRKWPLWGPSLRSNGQKFNFCQFFTRNFLAKWWPSEVATLGQAWEMGYEKMCAKFQKNVHIVHMD